VAIGVLSLLVGFAVNAARKNSVPMKIPAAYYKVESKTAKAIFLTDARRLFEAGDAIFIDARGPEEYERGQIEGACNVPLDRWQDLYPALSPWIEGKPVVIYAGKDQAGLADDLALALSSRVTRGRISVYIGGMEEWAGAGLPIRTGPDPILGGESDSWGNDAGSGAGAGDSLQ
jgi:rhodanese-related sulfurtransferase